MVRTETLGNGLIHTFSDIGCKLLQTDTGIVYDDAIDVPNSGHTYEEYGDPTEELTDAEALRIILGGGF